MSGYQNIFDLIHYQKTGGHVSSNLGVVELTVAMHKVFDSPKDKFIWDVGHQGVYSQNINGKSRSILNVKTI